MVTVIYMLTQEEKDLSGRMVQEVRAMYENVFNIPATAVPMVNGQQVDETHTLKDGDKLEFSKPINKAA